MPFPMLLLCVGRFFEQVFSQFIVNAKRSGMNANKSGLLRKTNMGWATLALLNTVKNLQLDVAHYSIFFL